MTDWFKVQMNEADRRIQLEVYAKNLVAAINDSKCEDWELNFHTKLLEEILNTPFDKYEGAEDDV